MAESEAVLLDVLGSYVPAFIKRHILTDPKPLTDPRIEHFQGAVLFVDIKGFTDLAEALAKQSIAGAEELSYLLNVYIEELVDLITLHGGDIVKFAGDALVGLWVSGTTDDDLVTITHRAAQCGLLIQAMLHDQKPLEMIRLSLRVGIGAGEVTATHVGGDLGRWEVLIAGDPLVQMGKAEKAAQEGQVILSHTAWNLIQDHCKGTVLDDGHVLIEDVHAPLSHRLEPPLEMPKTTEDALRNYIPGAILSRLTAKQTDWLAELRRVTVLFVNLPDLDHTTPVDRVQQVMAMLQAAIYRYEGSINKLSADDKGASLLAALGLHPLSHEDDPRRGVQAALAIQGVLRDLGMQGSIGVTTGQTFCGVVGSQRRREYTLISDAVNLSSRLMQVGPDCVDAPIPILCDEETYRATARDIHFETLPAIPVKGKAGLIPVFRPLSQKQRHIYPQNRPANLPALVGRDHEYATLLAEMQSLHQGGAGGTIIIEGEVGIGKSRLLEEVFYTGQDMGLTCLVGASDTIEKSTPYFAWRSIIQQLLKLDRIPTTKQQQDHVLHLAEQYIPDHEQRYLPLLNDVIPLGFAENKTTQGLSNQNRANKIRTLLTQLIQQITLREIVPAKRSTQAGLNGISTQPPLLDSGPLIIILEDTQWLDSASWALTLAIGRQVDRLLLVLASRPIADPQPAEYNKLTNASETKYIRLDLLSTQHALQLVQQRLGVTSLPKAVSHLISHKAEGHPFFSEEFAYNLRDMGLLKIEGNHCWLTEKAENLDSLDFPHTIRGIITSRIDRLRPEQQFILKVASVIGRIFPFEILHDIYPVEQDRAYLADYIRVLEQLDITRLEREKPNLAYIFKHISIQEVAYDLMLFSQRRQLHQAVAEWYEQTYKKDPEPYITLLAHHWSQAVGENSGQTPLSLAKPNIIKNAITYNTQAGDQALRSHAHQEAIDFYKQALKFLAIFPETSEFIQQEINLLIKLGNPLIALKGFANEDVSDIYTRASALCQKLDDTEEFYFVLQGLIGLYFTKADLQTAQELAMHLLEWAQQKNDVLLQVKALADLGQILMMQGEFQQAQGHLDEAINRYSGRYHLLAQEYIYQGVDPGVDAYLYSALNRWFLGYSKRAEITLKEGIALAAQLTNRLNQTAAHGIAAMLYQLMQNKAAALDHTTKLLTLAQDHQFAFWAAWGKIIQAWALADFSKLEDQTESFTKRIHQLREGLYEHSATGAALYRSYFLTLLAEMIGQSGQIRTALHLLENLLAGAAEYDEQFYVAEVLRVKGILLAQHASAGEAEVYFQQAIHTAQNQSAKALEKRARESLQTLEKNLA
ncbi:MAG: adenylate/guanylate cyclase domain-containing protein [Chloroflexota bacterium]